jgi:subtilisin family serine protease
MGDRPSRFCSNLVSWIFGTAAVLAWAGTAQAAAEIRIEPTALYFGAATPSLGASVEPGASARPLDVSEGLPAPGIQPEVLGALREKASGQRQVRVLVRLAAPFTPEGRQFSAQAVRDQRLAIDRVQDSVLRKLEKERVKLHARFEYIPFLALEVDAKALDRLAAMAEVNGLEEDVLNKPSLASSTAVIGAGVAWESGWTGDGQVIAVLDTGVDKTHPFFSSGPQNKVVSEACYSSDVFNYSTSLCPGGVEESTAPGSGVACEGNYDECDHGTMVAGIAAGDNGTGPGFGVARGADIISVQVFSRCGSYCLRSWVSDQIKGLERIYALAGQFDIAAVSMSVEEHYVAYGTRSNCDENNVARKAAIDNLRSIDIPTIAPSGNAGARFGVSAPGCISSAIGVGATDDTDEVARFSNVASFLDLLAPGDSIDSPVPGGGMVGASGTSMAAAHVVGAWAVLKQANPTATVSGLLEVLRDTAVPVRESGHDLRRINLGRAVGAPLDFNQLTIYNDGSTVLAVQSIQLETPVPWIRWSPEAPFDVPPGGWKTVKVSVDFGGAPAGSSMNRLLVVSNDADESPYPGGVFLAVDKQPCYLLTRARTGTGFGSNPVPGLASSPGCPAGQYHAGQVIPLVAQPATGSVFVAWSGTDNDGSTVLTNSVTMPAGPRTVSAAYQVLCYALTRTHTGSGADPVASPASSPGCPAGQYHYAERIELTASPALYWRVGSWTNTAADHRHTLTNSLSMPANTLTVAVNYSQGLPGVLVVDASFYSGYELSLYTQAVQASGRVYDVWDIETEGNPDAATLAAYPRVVWYPGTYGVLTSAQEQAVRAYLDGGGSLFLSAREYASYNLVPFLQDYLGVSYSDRFISYFGVTGQGPVFGGLGSYGLYYSGRGDLSPAPGAEAVFRFDDEDSGTGNAGVSKVGPGYRTLFLGFSFEALPTAEARGAVMAEALDFLGTVFVDVPRSHWAKKWVEALYRNGVTQGCGLVPRQYCPEGPVTRDQMAIFLLKAKEGSSYAPPPCTSQPFNDVSVGSPYCPWIQELVGRGITSGCGNGNYCPTLPVPREQMAFFLLKTLEGPGYAPPACTETPFPDVSVGSFFCPWIKELVQRGLTSGCGDGNYCPGQTVSRAQAAVFLVRTFGLPLF